MRSASIEEQMAHGSLLAIAGGLALAAPTALTGLLDWLDIPKGAPARATATVHLLAMVTATVLFALSFIAQLDGYEDGRIETLALLVGLVTEAVLTLGGYLGGTIVFVYGAGADLSIANRVVTAIRITTAARAARTTTPIAIVRGRS